MRHVRPAIAIALLSWLLPVAAFAVMVPNGESTRARRAAIATDLRSLPASLRARVAIEHVESESMKRTFRALVLLPEGGLIPGREYPLLVLLHAHGSPPVAWLRSGHVHQHVDAMVRSGHLPPCIVLMASGAFGYWVNWRDGHHPYGDLVVRAHLQHMRSRYPVSQNKDLVALAGASMGGFGALSLGLRNPDKFGFIAALSPTDMAIAVRREPRRKMYRRVLGRDNSMVPAINPGDLVQAGWGQSQRFVLAYGGREGSKFRVGTEQLAEHMRARGIDADVMRVDRGGHGWRSTWRPAIPFFLQRLGEEWTRKLAGG